MRLSALTFLRQFSRFEKQVRRLSSRQSFTSFREGLPGQWEDYKEDVREEALRLVRFRNWKRADVGKGRILDQVISAIEINDPVRKLRNNLVAWQNRYGRKNQSHWALLGARSDVTARRRFEQWFLDFFQNRVAEGEAFESFRQLAGDRYDIVAYLFFLKNWNQFMPIAPTNFDKAFRLLGVDLVTAHHCSWENYSHYNDALLAVKRALRELAGVADARLIDAHSFCWMLVRQKLSASLPAAVIPLPEVLAGVQALTLQPEPSANKTEFEAMDEERFIQRDAEQRRLGRLAREIALESEWRRLREAGHPKPEEAARPVWDEPARGYDILSCELDNTPRHIEVKAARQSGKKLSFFLTQYEWKQSCSLPNYYFYLVLNAESRTPSVLVVESGMISKDFLTPLNYLASLSLVS